MPGKIPRPFIKPAKSPFFYGYVILAMAPAPTVFGVSILTFLLLPSGRLLGAGISFILDDYSRKSYKSEVNHIFNVHSKVQKRRLVLMTPSNSLSFL